MESSTKVKNCEKFPPEVSVRISEKQPHPQNTLIAESQSLKPHCLNDHPRTQAINEPKTKSQDDLLMEAIASLQSLSLTD